MYGLKDEDKNHFLQFRSVHSLLAAATKFVLAEMLDTHLKKKGINITG